MFSIKPKKPGWMSVLLRGESVTLTHIVRSEGAIPKITLLENFAAEKSEKESLLRLKKAMSLASYRNTTLVRDGEYNLHVMDNPPVPIDERAEALRWVLKEMVDFPVETACIDVIDVPVVGAASNTRAQNVMTISASEWAIKEHIAPFSAANVPLEVVDIPELAQRNVSALLETDNRGLALLRVDESGMMLTLSYQKQLVAVRRADIRSTQLNSEDTEKRARAMERFILEAQRSLDNFDRQFSQIPISRVLLAMNPTIEGLVDELLQNISLPLEIMDYSKVIDISAAPQLENPEVQTQYLLAVGAALRNEGIGA